MKRKAAKRSNLGRSQQPDPSEPSAEEFPPFRGRRYQIYVESEELQDTLDLLRNITRAPVGTFPERDKSLKRAWGDGS